jgi:hypothetical protein
LYGYEILSLTYREEHRLRVVENREYLDLRGSRLLDGRWEMCTKFCLQSMKGRNCSEDNIKMDLKEVARRV